AQLRSVTWCAALEWFQAWDRLVERLPEIAQLAARARPASVASLPDRAADNDKADETPVSELEGHPPVAASIRNSSEGRARRSRSRSGSSSSRGLPPRCSPETKRSPIRSGHSKWRRRGSRGPREKSR
ncbi:unnamed protein product, partial [Polarella glacialis]